MVSPAQVEKAEREVEQLEIRAGVTDLSGGPPPPAFDRDLALWFPSRHEHHACPGVELGVLFRWRDLRSTRRSPARPKDLDHAKGTSPVVRQLIERYGEYPVLELWRAVAELPACEVCGQSYAERPRVWWRQRIVGGQVSQRDLHAAFGRLHRGPLRVGRKIIEDLRAEDQREDRD